MSVFDEFAFPFVREAREQYSGMTLRDYFAAKAMQGLLACAPDDGDESVFEGVASDAYKFADAMLKARLLSQPEEHKT